MSDAQTGARFRVTQSYSAGIGRLWAVLGTREYVERKYHALGSTALSVLRFDVDERCIEVELERSAPVVADALPAWAGALVGHRLVMRQRSRWLRVDAARVDVLLEIRMAARPVRAEGVGRLVERSLECSELTLEFQATCAIPVVGDEVSRLFAQAVRQVLEEDFAFTVDYLAAGGGRSRQRDDGRR